MYKKLLVVVCLIFFLVGCDRRREIYFYSPDKSQCITLIDENDIRYIINGKHQQLKDDGSYSMIEAACWFWKACAVLSALMWILRDSWSIIGVKGGELCRKSKYHGYAAGPYTRRNAI